MTMQELHAAMLASCARPARSHRACRRARRWAQKASAAWSSSAAATAARPPRSICACGPTAPIDVTLVEPNEAVRLLPDVEPGAWRQSRRWPTSPSATTGLRKYGVQARARHRQRDRRDKKQVRLASGSDAALRPAGRLARRRLHVRPVAGHGRSAQEHRVLHAWKAGPQTVALRRSSRRCATAASCRDQHPAGAVSLPARTVRARVPGRAGTSSTRSRRSRCWCSTPIRTTSPRSRCSRACSARTTRASSSTASQSTVARDRRERARRRARARRDVRGDVLN